MRTKAPSPIPYIFVALLLLAGGYWWFNLRQANPSGQANGSAKNQPVSSPTPSFSAPTSVPKGTQIRIDGSTSLAAVNQRLKRAFETRYAGTRVSAIASGSNRGIENLLAGKTDIAAISRSLTSEEQSQGLRAVPIASDAIALVVGVNNPFRGGLTSQQVEGIFKGTLKNWSQVGASPGTIQVVNRPAVSGTHQVFKELVLGNSAFGQTANIQTLPYDATTPLLRALGNDGIGYATYSQVVNQKTVRVVAINGTLPDSSGYPYQRSLFYAYKHPATSAVRAFLGYVESEAGQQAVFADN